MYMRDNRFPKADVDVFIYGLNEEEASTKLTAILEAWRRTAKLAKGVDGDALFVKTTNTVTCDAGEN